VAPVEDEVSRVVAAEVKTFRIGIPKRFREYLEGTEVAQSGQPDWPELAELVALMLTGVRKVDVPEELCGWVWDSAAVMAMFPDQYDVRAGQAVMNNLLAAGWKDEE
jgi:hypothetical protein